MCAAWTEFSQKEELTTRLANILDDYPPGITVFKEFLQNADDARASRFAVCLDHLQHGREKLLTPELALWQGAALCFYNDSEFSEDDFKSVSHLGQSVKSGDDTRIGRYGLGLNCAYHLSDLLSFSSGDNLVIFDPHGAYLPDKVLGLRANYVAEGWTEECSEQLVPFAWPELGSTNSLPPPGTLFRLALRSSSTQQTCPSKISSSGYSVPEARELLGEFAKQAAEMLLFLQHVSQLDIFERFLGPDGTPITRRLYSVGITNMTKAMKESRVISQPTSKVPRHVFEMHLRETPFDVEDKEIQHQWAVSVGMCTANPKLAKALKAPQWGGVATRLDGISVVGRAYCFLPLPVLTGLPLHLNAAFALTSNRRSLWSAEGGELEGVGLQKAQWNQLLLTKALPVFYGNLLEFIAKRTQGWDTIQQVWPDPSAASKLFEEMCVDTLTHVVGQGSAVFWVEGTGWHSLKSCLVEQGTRPCTARLRNFLQAKIKSLVTSLPEAIRSSLDQADVSFKKLTPKWLSQQLQDIPMTRGVADDLLEFMLPSEKATRKDFELLLGLNALPLANGNIGKFVKGKKQVFFASPSAEFTSTLLGSCPTMLDPLSPAFDRLAHPDCYRVTNIQALTPAALVDLLPYVLPATWNQCSCVTLPGVQPSGGNGTDARGGIGKSLSKKEEKIRHKEQMRLKVWMNKHKKECCPVDIDSKTVLMRLRVLWKFFDENVLSREDMTRLSDWPTVPTEIGYILSVPYAQERKVMFGSSFPEATKKLMGSFGCLFVPADTETSFMFRDLGLGHTEDAIDALAVSHDQIESDLDKCLSLRDCVLDWANNGIECGEESLRSVKPRLGSLCNLQVFLSMSRKVCLRGNAPNTPEGESDSPWEEVIAPYYADELLTFEGEKELQILKLGRVRPWSSHQFVNEFLVRKLNDELPRELCILFLREFARLTKDRSSHNTKLVVRAVSTANLIVFDSGKRKQCSDLLDPEETVFHDLFSEENFPPMEYRDASILGLLRQAGMQCLSNPKTFLRVAQRVAEVKSVKSSIALLNFLCNNHHVLSWSQEKLSAVASIPFAVAYSYPNPNDIPGVWLRSSSCAEVQVSTKSPKKQNQKRKTKHRDYEQRLYDETAVLDHEMFAEQPEALADWKAASKIINELCKGARKGNSTVPDTYLRHSFVRLSDRDCLIAEEAFLGWTAAPVIHHSFSPRAELILALRRRKYAVNKMLSHLTTVIREWQTGACELSVSTQQAIVLSCLVRLGQAVENKEYRSPLNHVLSNLPFVIADDGQFLLAQQVCMDLDEDVGQMARAPPPWSLPIKRLLMKIGSASLAGRAPPVRVTADPIDMPVMVRNSFNQPEFSDVKFCVESQEIYTHKLVLGLSSPVFRKMFTSGMAENVGRADSSIDERGFSYSAVYIMLKYLYTGKIDQMTYPLLPPSGESAIIVCDLMRLSDKYELEHLKQWTESYLSSSEVLDVYNVCDLLSYASRCNATQLVDLCLFQIRRTLPFVVKMEQWQDLPSDLQDLVHHGVLKQAADS